jgi:sortase A
MFAGLLMVVWGFVIWRWGDPVTALYTNHEQQALRHQYAKTQRTFEFALPVAATTGKSPSVDRAVIRSLARRLRDDAKPGSALGQIRVPELGLNMVFVAGTDTASLRKGPGWDQRTFLPGQGKLVYIAGHRTTYGAPFGNIERLKPGNVIELTLPYGRFVYRVSSSVIVRANDMARLVSRGRDEVVLQACHPRFSATQRYLVYARLVRVLRLTRS